MSTKTVFAGVVTCTIVPLGAACGGNGDSLSREELIEQGDALCTEYESRVDDVEDPENSDDVGRYVDEVKPIIEEGTDKLDELTPPEELQDNYDAWIELARTEVASTDDLKAAAAEGDDARIEEIVRDLRANDAEANRMAQSIGFQECGDES
jgi:hypothetical protein